MEVDKSCCLVTVIEDDDDIRESIRDVLESEGYRVTTFENGKEALEGLKTSDYPCLILLDLMMPIMDGWQFMEARKHLPETYSSIPVFIVSAVADPKKVKEAGAIGYLKKPIDLEILLLIVEKYCKLSFDKTPLDGVA